ncbi:uncharacterized protein PHALS_00785 [Plasmopara halstedii]|uniref:Uncharacterized protein n=1 Tax=Plasmopara halstedii TaxID=4781 RepID=A0A0P1ATG3_PLAHL|nr:uncharacterized protein PHALS_00785 [Plasmopara halstedii]CEG44417.1 hypothetical protein PHALS_00785 [Plasmopara halstedii]|eukprot:XP_024580786.1 hypothetical protein PHALS_00785 [Plasmopara halstedii]
MDFTTEGLRYNFFHGLRKYDIDFNQLIRDDHLFHKLVELLHWGNQHFQQGFKIHAPTEDPSYLAEYFAIGMGKKKITKSRIAVVALARYYSQ